MGVKVREKIKGSGVWWIFVTRNGRRKSKLVGSEEAARLAAKKHHRFAPLFQNGESLAYVKEQLGHSSIKVTVDVYGHLVPGANRKQ